MDDFVDVSSEDRVVENDGLVVNVNNTEIALFRVGGEIMAFDNECPHLGGPIGEGMVSNGAVTCPWHAWPFDLRTGECEINPAAKLTRYESKVEAGRVFVRLS
jgi:nitrite reductase/ring-hydroxylating ferredoxin subunit